MYDELLYNSSKCCNSTTITTIYNYVCMSFQMIQEIKCCVTENFSTIEKRLESLEIITKSPETLTTVSANTSSIRQQALV